MASFPLISKNKKGNSEVRQEEHWSGLVKYQLRIQPHLAEPADRTLASYDVHVGVCVSAHVQVYEQWKDLNPQPHTLSIYPIIDYGTKIGE